MLVGASQFFPFREFSSGAAHAQRNVTRAAGDTIDHAPKTTTVESVCSFGGAYRRSRFSARHLENHELKQPSNKGTVGDPL